MEPQRGVSRGCHQVRETQGKWHSHRHQATVIRPLSSGKLPRCGSLLVHKTPVGKLGLASGRGVWGLEGGEGRDGLPLRPCGTSGTFCGGHVSHSQKSGLLWGPRGRTALHSGRGPTPAGRRALRSPVGHRGAEQRRRSQGTASGTCRARGTEDQGGGPGVAD